VGLFGKALAGQVHSFSCFPRSLSLIEALEPVPNENWIKLPIWLALSLSGDCSENEKKKSMLRGMVCLPYEEPLTCLGRNLT